MTHSCVHPKIVFFFMTVIRTWVICFTFQYTGLQIPKKIWGTLIQCVIMSIILAHGTTTWSNGTKFCLFWGKEVLIVTTVGWQRWLENPKLPTEWYYRSDPGWLVWQWCWNASKWPQIWSSYFLSIWSIYLSLFRLAEKYASFETSLSPWSCWTSVRGAGSLWVYGNPKFAPQHWHQIYISVLPFYLNTYKQ